MDYWAFTPQDEITLLINSLHELNVLENVNIETGGAFVDLELDVCDVEG